jgi:hypothetical protein
MDEIPLWEYRLQTFGSLLSVLKRSGAHRNAQTLGSRGLESDQRRQPWQELQSLCGALPL